jgi:hypothetical protein
MDAQQTLGIVAAAAGTLGSILTAFSVNRSLTELNLARQFHELTLTALAEARSEVPLSQGLDTRYKNAKVTGTALLWLGVALLALGFILQSVCSYSSSQCL